MEREQRPADETHEQGMRGKEVALMSTNIRQASNDSTARVAGKVALVTGAAQDLLAAGLDEMRRTICEREPPKPSTRLTQELVAADVRRRNTGELYQTAASPRRLQELIHQLRGDMDWIVMKCLEKDRARRYDTANGLAMDIERQLKNELVVARPPSNLYRFQKIGSAQQTGLRRRRGYLNNARARRGG